MTALEKFNKIKGLEKLKENYPLTEFEIKVESESIIFIHDVDNFYFDWDLTFEAYYDELPFITAFVGFETSDLFDLRLHKNEASSIASRLNEVEKILGLED